MNRVILTGGSGFIGRHLIQHLQQFKHLELILVLRRALPTPLPAQLKQVVISDFRDEKAWESVLQAGDQVIHLAGLAHRDLPTETQVEGFFESNVATTRALAQAGAKKQISQFVFISSIGVYGSSRDDVITTTSALHPDQPYAESKLAAELALLSTAGRRYPCIILRLPLVYGADAPGNFGKLLRLVASGLPLPFAALKNSKSFLSITTLQQIIGRLLQQSFDSDYTLIAAEPEPVTLAALLRHLSEGMGYRARLFYVPAWLLRTMLTLAGKKKMYKKLCLTLAADSHDVYELLGWQPSTDSLQLIRQIGKEYKDMTQR